MNQEFIKFIILFFFYSFFGAILEHAAYYAGSLSDPSVPKKALANPVITGFPIYGMGAYMVILTKRWFVDRFNLPIGVEFLIYMSMFALFEYLIGWFVGAGEGSYTYDETGNKLVNSWDYSKNPGNIDGKIDIIHSVIFAAVGLVVARVHPYLEEKVECVVNR